MTQQQDFPEGAVLVVGGSGGIGSVICHAFGNAGTGVALTYRSNASRAEEVVTDLAAAGAEALALPVDVTNREDIARAVDEAIGRFGRIHTAVFVAGAMPTQKYISEYDDTEWREAFDIEVDGFYNLVRATLPHMKKMGGGSFVHLGSGGDAAWPNRDGLSVIPKAANEAMVRGLAREEGRFGIRANSVLIGVIEAGMYLKFAAAGVFDDAWVKATHSRLALKRLGKPEEVAQSVLFLASNRASYVTGQQIAVTGGYGL